MEESVNTGGMKTFVYSKNYQPKKSPEFDKWYKDAMKRANERMQRERKQRIIRITIYVIVIIVLFFIFWFWVR